MTDTTHAPAADLLYGVPEIAAHLKMTAAQVYHLHTKRAIPTFKIGGKVCARPSTLAAHFAEQEAAARVAAQAAEDL